VQFHLRHEGQFPGLDCLGDDPIVGRPVLDGYIFGASEIALEVDDLKILDIEGEEVSLLLVDDGKLLPDFDAWEELFDLLFV
jgi:hypothetical protein